MNESCLYSTFKTHLSGWEMGFHAHPHFEISAVLSGSGTFFIYNDDQAHPIHEGDIILVPPDVPHNFASSTPIRFAVLQVLHLPSEARAIFLRMTRDSFIYSLSYNKLAAYESLFGSWVNTAVQPITNNDRMVKLWIELLLLFINDSIEDVHESVSLSGVADYIRRNYDKDIRISELAKMAKMSENGFRAAFKKKFGQSPKQYLQAYRLSQAKVLLKSTTKSIQQVGEQVGFPNIHAFSAWFQNIEGKSPSLYRNENEGNFGTKRFL